MKYPTYIVERFAELEAMNEQGFDMLADCFDRYDPEMIELDEAMNDLEDDIRQMCETYASESGADLELDYNQDDWYEDLYRQYKEMY